MNDLNQKVAIVTGSSRGIGKAIATKLAADGANIVVTYHSNQERAEEVVKEIKQKEVDAVALQVNVRKIEDIEDMFAKAIEHFGKVDILVNNAAGKNVFKPTVRMTPEEDDSMFHL